MRHFQNVPESGTSCLSGAIIDPAAARRLLDALEIFRQRVAQTFSDLSMAIRRLYDLNEWEMEAEYWQWAARKAKYERCQKFCKQRRKRQHRKPQHGRRRCRRGRL